jgi:diguanylate cyclase (GGDEF)-like protein
LTQKDERSDRIAGLELGADDYITKPFDIEELKLRVRTAIRTHQRSNLTDPITGLPSGRLIEDQLRNLMRSSDWSLVLSGIDHMHPFNDAYGFVAGDEVLRFAALILNEVVDELGTLDDFIGRASSDNFILITKTKDVSNLVDKLRSRFNEEVKSHYNFMDREQDGIMQPDDTLAPLMTLSIGIVSDKTQRFSDIREITETAAELRRIDQEKS